MPNRTKRAYYMETNYEKQANDFLQKTNTKISVEFLKNDFYFDKDKSTRDIYKVTISRGMRIFTQLYGQSIMNSQYYQDEKFPERTYSLNGANRTGGYSILDINKYRQGGIMLELKRGKEPTNYDILACLTKYEVGTFENFCSEFGYSEDSRTAEKTYHAVCKEYDNVCKIWSDEEIEELQEIQ